jgi:Trk K+ transport system NAD-binding subunit
VDRPVLLCGLGRVGRAVLDCLRTAGVPVVAIDTAADPADARLVGVRVVRGDCRDGAILTEAGVKEARGVIVATSDDLVNISCALMVRRLAPDVRIVLRMFNQNLVTRLGKAVSNVTALSVSALAAPLLAQTAVTGDVLAAFAVSGEPRQVIEMTVPADSKLVGQPVASLNEGLRYVLLGHVPTGQAPRLLHDVDPTAAVGPADRLMVAGTPNDVRRLLEPGRDDLSDILWAGKLRRWWRVAYRTFAEIETPVKVCAIVMLVVLFGSAATYHYGLGRRWYDGLYQTISVIFTGSDLGGNDYEGWAKVFVSLLKMFGTVAVAAFTAIFTNYLIRARLGGVFEVRRIPDRGHVVVVGLGNVGYRVVEELDRLGERPVVVERKADNSFVPSCRRKRVPVLIGDATVRETLVQARAGAARAVIACTSADLANLEVALLVAELNEQQRVVVRLGDTVLAETARTAAGVKMALSIPELAAPAFVAGLLGDRVLSMFLVGGRMLAAVELTVQPDDAAFVGHSLRVLAVDYGVAPIAVSGPDGKARDVDAGYRLAAGDRFTVVATVPDLERITQRAAIPADWAVEVTAFPLTAREALALQARALRGLSAPEAEALVGAPPFLVAERQTRGQAEELVAVLQREKVTARHIEGRK